MEILQQQQQQSLYSNFFGDGNINFCEGINIQCCMPLFTCEGVIPDCCIDSSS